MTDVDALVRLLIEHSGTPIKTASATAIFETICGEALTIEVFTRATRCLTAQEYQLLTPSDATIGHERRGSCSKPGTLQPEVTLAAKNRSSTWPFGCGVPPSPSGWSGSWRRGARPALSSSRARPASRSVPPEGGRNGRPGDVPRLPGIPG